MRAAPALLVCALAALPAVGCGDIDGSTEPFPGTILYQDPSGAFEFRLLEPPWIPPFIVSFMGLSATFSVVPPPDATVTTDTNVLLSQALYSLQFSTVTGDPATAMATYKGSLPGGAAGGSTSPVTTAAGSTGVEMAWQETAEVFHRDAFLAGSATPTYGLHFTAQKPIDDDDMVGQMINSFRAK
jgi:hypothetical protein